MRTSLKSACTALIAGLLATSGRAQAGPQVFEGTWIWDAQDSQLPAYPPGSVHMTGETMSVARDNGRYYKAGFETHYSDGSTWAVMYELPEDGAEHKAGDPDAPVMERITVLPDGGRHQISTRGRLRHEVFCHVTPSGMTLICSGTHVDDSGSSSPFRCVYHRDPHVWPVS